MARCANERAQTPLVSRAPRDDQARSNRVQSNPASLTHRYPNLVQRPARGVCHWCMRIKLVDFVKGYIECALWCGVMSYDGEELENSDADYTDDDLTDEARETIESECRDFVAANISDLMGCELDSGQCGHDFYLTRNRHGAGYWDRKSRGKYANQCLDRLTEAAHAYGEQSFIADEDGYVSIL